MYQLIFHKNAEKGLKSLRSHQTLLNKLIKFFDQLALDPYSVSAKKLLGEWEGCYSYRAGSIRVIYEIEKDKLIIYVLEIGPRGDIY
jgi:mRNA interferase RelE/StbE